MKSGFYLLALLACIITVSSCDNAADEPPPVFCDTTCSNDTIKFRSEHKLEPYVYIAMSDCRPDTVIWSHKMLPSNLKIDFSAVSESGLLINRNYITCHFTDTSHVWIEFNDCVTGRGYLAKLNFSRAGDRNRYTSALTKFDPKFRIADGLICYADYNFVYVEDVNTGKTAQLKMSDEKIEVDWNNLHETFDSVSVSRNRIFVNLIQNGRSQKLEKEISL